MSTDTIARVFESVKQKSDKIFLSERIEFAVASEILEGPDGRAAELLRICDFRNIVPLPGMYFSTLSRIAGFYRIQEESYIKSVLSGCGITQKNFPDDVKRGAWLLDMIRRDVAGREGRYIINVGNDCCYIHDKSGSYGNRRIVPISPQQLVYSPRVVLALAAIMYYGRHTPKDSVASRVYAILEKSDYYIAALDRVKRIKKGVFRTDGAQKIEEECNISEKENGIPVSPDGEMVFTPEVFAYTMGLVMKDMTEGMMSSIREMNVATIESIGKMTAEIISEIRKSSGGIAQVRGEAPEDTTFRRGGSYTKLKKPENWDEVVAALRKGLLTNKKAAEMTGMSLSSFRNYLSGKSKF